MGKEENIMGREKIYLYSKNDKKSNILGFLAKNH